MIVTYATFVAQFPKFTDTTAYPESSFNFWEAAAEDYLNGQRFGNSMPLAIMLYVAHNLMIDGPVNQPGRQGVVSGILNSASVGAVSKGYDTASVSMKDAGHWNATSYGMRLFQMFKSYGLGPVYRPGRGSRRLPF